MGQTLVCHTANSQEEAKAKKSATQGWQYRPSPESGAEIRNEPMTNELPAIIVLEEQLQDACFMCLVFGFI